MSRPTSGRIGILRLVTEEPFPEKFRFVGEVKSIKSKTVVLISTDSKVILQVPKFLMASPGLVVGRKIDVELGPEAFYSAPKKSAKPA